MNDNVIISGIQQIGVGVPNVYPARDWYRRFFGFRVKMFDEKAIADIMAPYMGGQARSRHAVLVVNLQGGGGFEVWQHTGHAPNYPKFKILPGDLGIFCCKIKSKDIEKSYQALSKHGLEMSPVFTDKNGEKTFLLRDAYNNIFQMVKGDNWYMDRNFHCGGVYGAMIGTQDMQKSIDFYKNILGYDVIVSDETGSFEDFAYLNAPGQFRRVVLTHSQPRTGSFSKIFSDSQIELVQSLDRTDIHKIFEGRMWGDVGFIQICFDITNMDAMEKRCQEFGYPFTIDSRKKSGKFDMGEATGHFAYNEDPSGTLIEYVETEKIPILKKFNIYLNLKKRDRSKPLPDWILHLLKFMEK